MKYIQFIFVLLLTFGLTACSVDEKEAREGIDHSLVTTIRLLPIAPSVYDDGTRVTTDGTAWSEGDVVFVRVVFYADEDMTNETSFLYTAMRCGSDGSWGTATGSPNDNVGADFVFKTIDAGADDALWSTNNEILWPSERVKRATVQAIYAGQHPAVELLSEGTARIRVNAEKIGFSEMLTFSRSLSQSDLSAPVDMLFSHRLTRFDFEKELEEDLQIVSGSSGSGVNLIPITINFSGEIVVAFNKIDIPAGQRYIYIAPDRMIQNDASRIFRLQTPKSAAVIAAFSLPPMPTGDPTLGVGYYYGRSYRLAAQNSGGVNPDDMLPTMIP